MPSLAGTSLSATERRVLDRLVRSLEEKLRDDLLAVWLYGSRARGEPRRDEDSDVDLLVVTSAGRRDGQLVRDTLDRVAEAEGANPFAFSVFVYDADALADRRAIDSFFIREVDRDRVVLHGDGFCGAPESVEPPPGHGMRRRSRELMEQAYENLESARLVVARELFAPSIGDAYYAMVNAGRAALSEEDRYSRTHRGLWHLLREIHVANGRMPADLVSRAQKAQQVRWYADYAAGRFTREVAEGVLADAERLVALVEDLYR